MMSGVEDRRRGNVDQKPQDRDDDHAGAFHRWRIEQAIVGGSEDDPDDQPQRQAVE